MTITARPRYPLVALLLNVFLPGLGHLYIGRADRWGICVGITLGVYFLLGLAGALSNFWGYLLALAAFVAAYLFLLIDAPVLARQRPFEPKWYNRASIYIVFALALFSYSNIMLYLRPALLGVNSFRVPTDSMSPTLLAGDYILADTKAYRSSPPVVGDVVVATVAAGGTAYVRRVAVGSDPARIRLEADNPDLSQRGNKLIEVAVSNVSAKITYIYFSTDTKRIGAQVK